MTRSRRTTLLLGASLVALSGAAAAGIVLLNGGLAKDRAGRVSNLQLQDIPFNGGRAYDYLKQVVDIGPRQSASVGMHAQQKLLAEHFKRLGGEVLFQNFRIRHPQDGSPVHMANLIVTWRPKATERILLCAHYDTRPFPDRDPHNPQGTFVGANDGGSGVALLMEMAHSMADWTAELGVDFVLLDGEEFVFTEDDPYFWGSEYFARTYVAKPPGHRYRWGVLLDMVADADLQLLQERNSMSWRDTRPLVESIWKTAQRLGVREFIAKPGYQVNDDHIKLRNIGKIPTCDVIDFDYPHWHTEGDTADKCSALSLAKVGWVVHEWMKSEAARN